MEETEEPPKRGLSESLTEFFFGETVYPEKPTVRDAIKAATGAHDDAYDAETTAAERLAVYLDAYEEYVNMTEPIQTRLPLESFEPPIHIPTLADSILDSIINADCFCNPGDPSCQDWRNSDHRWHTIHRAVMNTIERYPFSEEPQSNLVDHAKRELELIGEDPEFIDGYLNVIQAFADMNHSGGSAMVAIPVINELLQFKNLKPLTNNPDEWMKIDEDVWGDPNGVWQCKRNHEAFSNDGGKTYYLLSEGGSDKNRSPLHISEEI